MKHKRITKLLKKISVLNESIAEDDEFSAIERDHMVNYIKELYEEAKGAPMIDADEEDATAESDTEEEYEIVEDEEVLENETIEEEIVEEALVEEKVEEVSEQEIMPKTAASEEIEKETPAPVVEVSSPELDAIFETTDGDDLSDRLSTMPIKDLTKSMGINEKIFTIKELFGDDQAAFNNMMEALNGLSSFEEAKKVLINSVAIKYDWSAEKKVKKAEHFVRLVRRRYM